MIKTVPVGDYNIYTSNRCAVTIFSNMKIYMIKFVLLYALIIIYYKIVKYNLMFHINLFLKVLEFSGNSCVIFERRRVSKLLEV